MTKMRVLAITLIASVAVPSVAICQVKGSTSNYVLSIESANPENPTVTFTAAYAVGDSVKVPVLTIVTDQKTPSYLRLSEDNFIGLFNAKTGISIRLAAVKDGKVTSSAKAQGSVIILHAEKGAVHLGWPTPTPAEGRQ